MPSTRTIVGCCTLKVLSVSSEAGLGNHREIEKWHALSVNRGRAHSATAPHLPITNRHPDQSARAKIHQRHNCMRWRASLGLRSEEDAERHAARTARKQRPSSTRALGDSRKVRGGVSGERLLELFLCLITRDIFCKSTTDISPSAPGVCMC